MKRIYGSEAECINLRGRAKKGWTGIVKEVLDHRGLNI